jgi:tetratricopeptide (TPR) repeat protein
VLYGYLEEWDKAIADYTKAIEVNPHHDLAWGNRGMAYYALGDMVSAYRDVTSALKVNPKSIHQFNLQHFEGKGVFGITTCVENTSGVDIPNFTYQR